MFLPASGAMDLRDARAARNAAEAAERGESRAGSVYRQGAGSATAPVATAAPTFGGGGQMLGRGDPSAYVASHQYGIGPG
jgi:hypothetical protein